MRLLALIALLALTSSIAEARTMKLTIYDDGASCPSSCDAHVVFFPTENGTRYAYSPKYSRSKPKKCIPDQDCMICFSERDASCMKVMYRANGPKAGRFDFTPKFYTEYCAKSDIPDELRVKCTLLDERVANNGWDKRINCFKTPTDPKYVDVIAKGKAAQAADIPKRDKCIHMGARAYNREQADPKEQRSDDCYYTKLKLGRLPGNRWHNLLPGACRTGETYAASNGLDCCSGDLRFVADNGKECIAFFPQ